MPLRLRRSVAPFVLTLTLATACASSSSTHATPGSGSGSGSGSGTGAGMAEAVLTATWNGKALDVVRVAPDDHGPVSIAPGSGQPALEWEFDSAAGAILASGTVADPSVSTAEFATDGTPKPVTTTGTGLLELRVPNVVGTLRVLPTTAGATSGQSAPLRTQGICTSGSANCGAISAPVPVSLTVGSGGATYTVKKILDHGACAPINMLFVSEGFQAGEMSAFEAAVQGVVSGLPSFSGYAAHMNDINVWALEVPSTDSGITDPGCAKSNPPGMDDCTQYTPTPAAVARNTAFGASFGDNINSPRRAVAIGIVAGNAQANAALADAKRQVKADVTGFIFNDPGNLPSGYGGSADIAGRNFTTSSYSDANVSVVSVAAHESGHALFGLQDEYTYGDTAATCAQEAMGTGNVGRGPFPLVNVTSNMASPPWSGVQGAQTIAGAYYCQAGFYRSQDLCLMQVLSSQFCSVCLAHVEQIVAQKEQYAKCACPQSADAGATSDASATADATVSGDAGSGLTRPVTLVGDAQALTCTVEGGVALTGTAAVARGWWPFSWP